MLTHQGLVTRHCVIGFGSIGSVNGMLPIQCQAITHINGDILSIGLPGTNFSLYNKIYWFLFNKMHLQTSSARSQPLCSGTNVLKKYIYSISFIKNLYNKQTSAWNKLSAFLLAPLLAMFYGLIHTQDFFLRKNINRLQKVVEITVTINT